jgi:hypothetical protein
MGSPGGSATGTGLTPQARHEAAVIVENALPDGDGRGDHVTAPATPEGRRLPGADGVLTEEGNPVDALCAILGDGDPDDRCPGRPPVPPQPTASAAPVGFVFEATTFVTALKRPEVETGWPGASRAALDATSRRQGPETDWAAAAADPGAPETVIPNPIGEDLIDSSLEEHYQSNLPGYGQGYGWSDFKEDMTEFVDATGGMKKSDDAWENLNNFLDYTGAKKKGDDDDDDTDDDDDDDDDYPAPDDLQHHVSQGAETPKADGDVIEGIGA